MSPARRPRDDEPSRELSIRQWAAELEAAAQIARQLAPTAFIPESLKRYFLDERTGKPRDGKDGRPALLDLDATTATAAAAIMTGQELGLPVMASLRSIAIINNTPSLLAMTLRAILQHAGHEIWVDDVSNATRAIVHARRADSDQAQTSTWTIERATKLGLYPGKEYSNWRKQPQNMLVARATAEAARWIAADAVLGIPYATEELIDQLEASTDTTLAIEGSAADNGDGQAPAKRRARRKSAAAVPALPAAPPADEPPLPAETDPAGPAPATFREPTATATEPRIAKPQLDLLHAGLREIGITGREHGLDLVSGWVGRKITTTAELTVDEAHRALDALRELRTIARQPGNGDEQPPPDQEPPR
jgi:hypothetical protein